MIATSWKDAYGLGLPEIDRQHQRLLEIIDRLDDALQEASPKTVVQSVISDLVTYSHLHFIDEEEEMRRHGYPRRLDHSQEHQELRRQLASFEQELIAGETGLNPRTINYLRGWVGDHILDADAAFATYLKHLKSNVKEMPVCR